MYCGVSLETLAVLRGEDLLAYVGEGRFAGLAPEIGPEDERRVLARIVGAIERAVPARGALATVTATAGSACFPRSGQTIDELFATAETDLAEVQTDRAATLHRLHEELVPERSAQDCRNDGSGTAPGWVPTPTAFADRRSRSGAASFWSATPFTP